MENRLPSFLNYDSKDKFLTDNGLETLMDFFLSWTLRCSEEKFQMLNPILYEYARKAVYGLIYGFNNEKDEFVINSRINESFKVLEVKTRRQWKRIDLLFELKVVNNLEEKQYILNIENKWYSGLSKQQLRAYKNLVEAHFDIGKFEIINLYISVDNCRKYYKEEKQSCRENNYKFLTVVEMKEFMETKDILTGSDLFDEFWFIFLGQNDSSRSKQAT